MSEDKFDFALVRVKFKEIRPDNLNPRHQREPEADQTLKRLIDTHGTIDMMWICKDPDGHFRLLDGHRRYDVRVEEGYIDNNPTVTCVILLAKDDPDRTLTDEEITLWRILRERGKEKWKDFDFYLKAVEHADSQKEKGRKYFQIAREDFNWNPTRLSHIKSVLEDPILSDFLSHGTISMHEAVNLLNIPAETQKDLIERKDALSAKELRETVKLVREGVETASAIESVKESKEDTPDDPLSTLIASIPENLRERFTKDTEDFNLRDIERIVKLIANGVVMHDAIRTVKLSQTETPQEEEGEETGLKAPSSSETELTVEDKAAEFASPVVDSETVGEEGHSPQQDATPLTSSSTPKDGIVAQTLGIEEKGTEGESPAEEEPEEKAKDEEKKKPPLETKADSSELALCKAFRTVKSTLQKYAKKPAKAVNGQFKTDAQRNEVVSTLKDIETHARTVRLNIESESNGRSHSCCSVIDLVSRVKEAEGHTYALLPGESEIAHSNIDDGLAVLRRMKEEVVNAKRGG